MGVSPFVLQSCENGRTKESSLIKTDHTLNLAAFGVEHYRRRVSTDAVTIKETTAFFGRGVDFGKDVFAKKRLDNGVSKRLFFQLFAGGTPRRKEIEKDGLLFFLSNLQCDFQRGEFLEWRPDFSGFATLFVRRDRAPDRGSIEKKQTYENDSDGDHPEEAGGLRGRLFGHRSKKSFRVKLVGTKTFVFQEVGGLSW